MKKIEKIISLIENGYGFTQMMESAGVDKEELIELMHENETLNKKLRKRFGDDVFEVAKINPENKEEDSEQNETEQEEQKEQDQDVENKPSEMEMLRAEADALGIQYNPMIGAEKLRARIEEFKAQQQQ